jgi:release factor glutamine methyltransferase
MDYISKRELKGRSLLELGAGSGLIALHAARRGAKVTASDINPVAVRFLQLNAETNKIPISILQSDLFDSLAPQQFDLVIINPPYYKKDPVTEKDHAWYCGENGEYFQKLFRGLGSFMHGRSDVIMILCDGCDLPMVQNFAKANGMEMHCVHTVRTLIEKNFIFKVTIQDESR